MSDLIPTKDLVTRLKSGEYDGGDLMQAWCRLETLEAKIKELESQLEAAERPAPCERYCEQVAFKRIIAGLEKKIEALQSSKASESETKALAVEEAASKYEEANEVWDSTIGKLVLPMDVSLAAKWLREYAQQLRDGKL